MNIFYKALKAKILKNKTQIKIKLSRPAINQFQVLPIDNNFSFFRSTLNYLHSPCQPT